VLTEELRGALRAATDQQPFEPNVSRVPVRVRQLRRRRTVTWVAVGVATIGVVTGAGVLATTGSADRVSPSPLDKASAALVSEVDNWGPTRGSFANDAAFLARVDQEWLHPTGRYYGDPRMSGVGVLTSPDGTTVVQRSDPSRHLTGDVHVLYAGQTPDGPAAVVAQASTLKDVGMYLGIMTPTNAHDLRLAAAYTPKMYAQREFNDQGLDTNQINFKTSNAGEHLVVLPANPSDSVSISLSHTLDATGHVQRTWSSVQTTDGVGVVTATGPLGFWDALIRVSDNGDVIDESQAWDVLWLNENDGVDAQPPPPANAINWPLSDQGIGGAEPGGGLVGGLYDPWITRYAAADEPYGGNQWVTDSPQDGHEIVVGQLWLYGDPAHTFVLRVVDRDVQLLVDKVTDPNERPLVFLRLPGGQDWLVAAGPDTAITGWREAGTSKWSDIDTTMGMTIDGHATHTRMSTFIATTADHIQVRMDVNGKTQIASK
jgi:hypothetical protein